MGSNLSRISSTAPPRAPASRFPTTTALLPPPTTLTRGTVCMASTHTSGSVVWYVNVTKLHDHTSNYWEMVIGVAHTTTRGANVFINSQEGVGYIQENGDKTQSGSSPDHTSYGSSYTVGDVIGVHLNIDAQTLSFSKNGISEGTAYTSGDIVSGKTWRLAVMVGDEDDEVEIVG